MTHSLLSDYLAPLPELPSECQHKLELIGELLHESRNAALVFKKNAGKYVGNFNYANLDTLTMRADLVFLAGLRSQSERCRLSVGILIIGPGDQ